MQIHKTNRKHPNIDLFALYKNLDLVTWNYMLTQALKTQDLDSLTKMLYGIQACMSDYADAGLGTENIGHFFIKLQNSLENTAKRVFKLKMPCRSDNIGTKLGLTELSEDEKLKKYRRGCYEQWLEHSKF